MRSNTHCLLIHSLDTTKLYTLSTHSLHTLSQHNLSSPNTRPQVEPGDGVRFRDFAGADVKLEGVDYRVVRGYDILAKWKQ